MVKAKLCNLALRSRDGRVEYRKSYIKPPRAYVILNIPEGGLPKRRLIREGGLVTKSNDKYIYDTFRIFTPYSADSAYNFTSQVHKLDKSSIPNNIKTNMQACSAR